MKIIQEFKEFAMRGSVMDLAVGVIIGGAFGKIVSSLVNDIIMPPVGYLAKGVNFVDLKLSLKNGVVILNYGSFIQNVVDFIIIAFVIFMMVKGVNRLQRKKPEEKTAPEMSAEEKLLTEIRDILKSQKDGTLPGR